MTTLAVTDSDVRRLLAQVEQGAQVIFYPVQRGTPWCICRGDVLVHMPGEPAPRELLPYEVEALTELGRTGELRFVTPLVPRLGRWAATPPPLPTIRFETGRELTQLDPDFPFAAFADGPGEG